MNKINNYCLTDLLLSYLEIIILVVHILNGYFVGAQTIV